MTSTWPRVTNLAAFYDVHHQSGQVSLNPNCPRTGGEGGALWLVSDPQSPQQHRGFYTTTSVPSAPPAALTHSAPSALRPPAHNRQMIRRHEMPGGGIWSAGDQSDCSSITWCTLSRISERPFTHTHTLDTDWFMSNRCTCRLHRPIWLHEVAAHLILISSGVYPRKGDNSQKRGKPFKSEVILLRDGTDVDAVMWDVSSHVEVCPHWSLKDCTESAEHLL